MVYKNKKIAIIGASYLQDPLILKAKSMGIETHVFAWAAGDIGEEHADYFYPISIIEKDIILDKCREIGIDGICSIASDLASVTVNYVADKLGLICNTPECVQKSTNKHLMRECFEKNGDPSPKSILVESIEDIDNIELAYPVIVKPLDRSGSRGITKLENPTGLSEAIETAKECGFIKKALVEEFVTGEEYSVEYISWQGMHRFLALTKKYTTGSPHFIETGHLEPAQVDTNVISEIKNIVEHALNSLGIIYGASHSEIKIDSDGNIKIIEIGARMGGDYIGSHLVRYSTGIDFVKAVVQVALGEKPDLHIQAHNKFAFVRFIMSQKDLDLLEKIKNENPEVIIDYDTFSDVKMEITDSSNRHGYFIMCAEDKGLLNQYMHNNDL